MVGVRVVSICHLTGGHEGEHFRDVGRGGVNDDVGVRGYHRGIAW